MIRAVPVSVALFFLNAAEFDRASGADQYLFKCRSGGVMEHSLLLRLQRLKALVDATPQLVGQAGVIDARIVLRDLL